MTDNAESKVREWAQKKNGDPLTVKDVVDLVLAVDADSDERHEETLELLAQHVKDDKARAAVIADELTQWRALQAEECANRHRVLFTEEMLELPRLIRRPHRASDPESADYRLKAEPPQDEEVGDMKRAWRFLKWFVVAFGLIFIDMFARYLSHTLFGYSS